VKTFVCLISLIWAFNGAHAYELTIATGPNFPREQLDQVFEPLSQQIKAATGYQLKVVSSMNYYFYWKDATRKRPDLSFDDPHVAAYRIKHLGYIPLVKSNEPTIYHLIMGKDRAHNESALDELNTQKLITMQHPSIASILFEDWFAASVVLPTRLIAGYAWSDCLDSLQSGKSQAAIVPHWLLNGQSEYVSVKQSVPYLGTSILAAPDLDPDLLGAIKSALLTIDKGNESLHSLNTEKFVAVDPSEYSAYIDLIPRQYLMALRTAD
jgi:hypothetical protein